MPINIKKTELGRYNEILYYINIYEKDGKLKLELDEQGNIKTNINGFISEIIKYENKGKIITVDHDLYYRINNGINLLTGKISDNINKILEGLYYGIKKSA